MKKTFSEPKMELIDLSDNVLKLIIDSEQPSLDDNDLDGKGLMGGMNP